MNPHSLVQYLMTAAMVFFLVLTFEGTVVALRGRSGGRSRSGSRSRSSRGSSSSSSSRPRISPNTPIVAKTYKSPIIKSQATVGSSSGFKRGLIGSAITYNVLARAPVYRGYYPIFYRSRVHILDNRAIRIKSRDVKLTDTNGENCFKSTDFPSGYDYSSTNDVYLNSTKISVKYENRKETAGENITLKVLGAAENVNITSKSEFDRAVIPETNCTRVTVALSATVVEMYLTNPAAGSAALHATLSYIFLLALHVELMRRGIW